MKDISGLSRQKLAELAGLLLHLDELRQELDDEQCERILQLAARNERLEAAIRRLEVESERLRKLTED